MLEGISEPEPRTDHPATLVPDPERANTPAALMDLKATNTAHTRTNPRYMLKERHFMNIRGHILFSVSRL